MQRVILAFGLGLAVIGPAAAQGTTPAGSADEVLIKVDERRLRAVGIDTARVQAESGMAQAILNGTVVVPPQQLRIVAAPAAGLVETVRVSPNEAVKAGQTLATLRSTDLLEAQRTYLQALSGEALAAQRLSRDEQMYRERIIAERRLLTTRAEHEFARTTLEEREQMLQLLGMPEADLRMLKRDRRMAAALVVTAPEDGVVLEVKTSAGERVAASAPLFSIARLVPLWINLQVPLPQASIMEPGTRVSIPGTAARGEVIRLGRSVDMTTQSVTAVAEVQTGAELLRPGQVVQAAVTLRASGVPQWRVPGGAVVRHAGRSWIFVKVTDGFLAKPVTVVAETPSTVTIRAPLTGETEVATRGIQALLGDLVNLYRG